MSESTRLPKVSVITVNYNETPSTCALLDNLRSLDCYAQLQVIVVDNASRENPVSLMNARYPEVRFIRSEKNLGFAGGNNLALPYAQGDYLFFVNNDALLERGCVEALVECFRRHPDAGCAGQELGRRAGHHHIRRAYQPEAAAAGSETLH